MLPEPDYHNEIVYCKCGHLEDHLFIEVPTKKTIALFCKECMNWCAIPELFANMIKNGALRQ